MTGCYPRGIALHEKVQRLAIEAGQCPLTLGADNLGCGRQARPSVASRLEATGSATVLRRAAMR